MKKLIFISIILSLIVATATAQGISTLKLDNPTALDNPDPGGAGSDLQYPYAAGTISRSGYTYKYRDYKLPNGFVITGVVEIYNASNKYTDVAWAHKDGSMKSEGESLGYYENDYYFSYSSLSREQRREIVAGAFTSQQKATLKGSFMFIGIRMDTSTGRVSDVYFNFRKTSPFAKIPVETFRSIELAFKERLTITSTAAGRRFNYFEFFWDQDF